MRRVGHKGADLIAPGNTFASFQAALEAGVDMIEFDVLPEHPDGSGELLLAHDYGDAARRTPHTLEEGLEHFCGEAYGAIDLDVDLKLPGYEERVVGALRRFGLDRRALISTMERASLRLMRQRHPEVRLGWSVPRIRRNPFERARTAVPAYLGLKVLRRTLPGQARRAIAAGAVDAVMANHRLVTPRLADAVRGAGGELFVWTVDDARRIAWLEGLGVTGVITNDPRLFDPAAVGAAG
ncbi:MAG TPA: glycerophosphodiester phosphodiesterase [Solirubrobacteraceae bacterium]|nr:glycerophosphodiester phosphodiesterase [Solirubrobacteraceae bacterium]